MTTPRRSPRPARTGLTLLEVVAATAVLSVVLLGMFSGMAHGMRMDALSRERQAAVSGALQQIEERVMVVGTDTSFDAIIDLDEGFDVTVSRSDAAGDLGTYALREPASNPEDTIEPHGNGQVGRLQVTGDLDGSGTVKEDAGYYGDKVNLVLATATVRWRGIDGRDQEVVVTSMKVRP
jgi:type II secretory pathway pseudopilin PulG